jgi:hypothetical protein
VALFKREKAPAVPSMAPVATTPPNPSVEFDDKLGNTVAHRLFGELSRGEWRGSEEYAEQLIDWDERNFLAGVLAEVEALPSEWLEQTTGSSFAYLTRGTHGIRRAWKVRGSGQASTVGEGSWAPFNDLLVQAESDLFKASDLLPLDPSPWARLISTGMGLGISKEEILRRFSEANSRALGFQAAHISVVGAVAKKWNGSHELMFSVAREADQNLPEGSPGRVAICEAHYERRLYAKSWEKFDLAAKEYYKDQEVCSEIEGAALRSVFSDSYEKSVVSPILWSRFAMALALTGDAVPEDRIAAAALFDCLGDSGIPSSPWSLRWGSKGGEQFARIRSLCRKAASDAAE